MDTEVSGKPEPGRPVLAVDIGGTKIITALIDGSGRMMAKDRCLTLADEGAPAVMERLFSAIDGLLERRKMEPSQLAGVSLAAAGAIDSGRGLITVSPNLPGWHDVPLGDMVRQRYGTDAFLINDASAAALGECRFGAGRGVSNLVLLTLGTGIGGGIVINGEIYLGACGSAGEVGHMVIDVNGPRCGCGNQGCLEAMASGTAVARDAQARVRQGEKSALVDMVEGKIEAITTEQVGDAARDGDSLALDVLGRAGTYLGVGMASLIDIFNPEMIVLGGGMAKLGDLFLEPARRVVATNAFPISAQAVRIVTAQLGEEAGVYGAAAFAFGSRGG
ncbi:ROK family protein [Chloroflexota bacterium]